MTDSTCHYCQGNLVEKTVTRVQQFGGRWFIIENVPALVCAQCGEVFYTPQAHDLVVRLISGQSEPARVEQVVVYDAAQAG